MLGMGERNRGAAPADRSCGSGSDVLGRLTPRERQVLSEIATGASNYAIAQRMLLSRKAVENYINSIFAKLDLTADLATDRRVKAVLVFLGDRHSMSDELTFRTDCVKCGGAIRSGDSLEF